MLCCADFPGSLLHSWNSGSTSTYEISCAMGSPLAILTCDSYPATSSTSIYCEPQRQAEAAVWSVPAQLAHSGNVTFGKSAEPGLPKNTNTEMGASLRSTNFRRSFADAPLQKTTRIEAPPTNRLATKHLPSFFRGSLRLLDKFRVSYEEFDTQDEDTEDVPSERGCSDDCDNKPATRRSEQPSAELTSKPSATRPPSSKVLRGSMKFKGLVSASRLLKTPNFKVPTRWRPPKQKSTSCRGLLAGPSSPSPSPPLLSHGDNATRGRSAAPNTMGIKVATGTSESLPKCKPTKAQQSAAVSGLSPFDKRMRVLCDFCGRPGHTSEDCRRLSMFCKTALSTGAQRARGQQRIASGASCNC